MNMNDQHVLILLHGARARDHRLKTLPPFCLVMTRGSR